MKTIENIKSFIEIVEWSLHNPHPDKFVWEGMGDIEQFIRLAAEEDLLVILRPGPYICAERDMV